MFSNIFLGSILSTLGSKSTHSAPYLSIPQTVSSGPAPGAGYMLKGEEDDSKVAVTESMTIDGSFQSL